MLESTMSLSWRDRIGRKVRTARVESHLTQERLAELVGLTTQSISYFENGKRWPSIDTINKIASVTNQDVQWFFEEPPADDVFRRETCELSRLNQLLSWARERARARLRVDLELDRASDEEAWRSDPEACEQRYLREHDQEVRELEELVAQQAQVMESMVQSLPPSSDAEKQDPPPSSPPTPDRPAWVEDLRASVTEVSTRTEAAIVDQKNAFVGEMVRIGEQLEKRDNQNSTLLDGLMGTIQQMGEVIARNTEALEKNAEIIEELRQRLLEGEAGSEDCGLSQSESGGTSPFGHGGDPLHDDMGPHEAAG